MGPILKDKSIESVIYMVSFVEDPTASEQNGQNTVTFVAHPRIDPARYLGMEVDCQDIRIYFRAEFAR